MTQTMMQISSCSRSLSDILHDRVDLRNIKDDSFDFVDEMIQDNFFEPLNLKMLSQVYRSMLDEADIDLSGPHCLNSESIERSKTHEYFCSYITV